MLRGLTSDGTLAQPPQFFDIPTERERQGPEGIARGRSRTDDKRLPLESVVFPVYLAGKIETARNASAQVFASKMLRKTALRTLTSAASLKQGDGARGDSHQWLSALSRVRPR